MIFASFKRSQEDLKKIIPGFTMGIVRASISHPFEMMKLKTQIGIKENFYKNLFKGVHYSIITNALLYAVAYLFIISGNNIGLIILFLYVATCSNG